MVHAFLGEITPALAIADPPYGIRYKARSATGDLYRLKVKNDHVVGWGDAFRCCRAPVLYSWFSYQHYDIVARALAEAGYDVKQMCVWVKNHFSLQRHMYHLQHEQCLVAVHQDAKVTKHWLGDRKQSSVWQVSSVARRKRIHATEKPVELYKIAIRNHTKEGDWVYDPFGGSGSALVASEELGRRGVTVELCPEACGRMV